MRADAAEYESDERFDVIVFNECLYYFDDPVALVRKYERLLRDDGVFIVSMYGVDRTERLWPSLLRLYACADGVRVTHASGKFWNIKVMQPKPA